MVWGDGVPVNATVRVMTCVSIALISLNSSLVLNIPQFVSASDQPAICLIAFAQQEEAAPNQDDTAVEERAGGESGDPDVSAAGGSEEQRDEIQESPDDDSLSDFLPSNDASGPVFKEDFLPEDMPEADIDSFNPWQAVAGSLLVLALLFVLVWFLRKFAGPNLRFTLGRQMRHIETLSLGMGKQVILVQVGDRILILGATQNGISLLDKMSSEQFKMLQDREFEHVEMVSIEEIDEPIETSFSEKLGEVRKRLEEVKDE